MSEIIILNAHGFRAEIWRKGANTVRLVHTAEGVETPMLYAPEQPEAGETPRWFGSWPMLPMCNRAFAAKLDTGFGIHDLPANDPSGANIHGFSWQNTWDVVAQRPNRVVLQHVARGLGPFDYTAQTSVTLEESGVSFDLSVTHQGEAPLPYGMGFHPWFPADGDTLVSFKAAGEIYMAEGFRPVGSGPVRAMHDFSHGRGIRRHAEGLVGGLDCETAANYLEWDGTMQVHWPKRRKALVLNASPNLRSPVVWSPVGAEFVCFEPQSHAVGAQTEGLVRALAPMRILARGETLHGSMRLSLRDMQ